MKSLSNIPGGDPRLPAAFRPQEEKPAQKDVKSFWAVEEKAPAVQPKPYTFSDLEARPAPPAPEAGAPQPEAAAQPELEPPAPAAPSWQEEAKREAEAILQAARADARLLREQAAEEGRAEGYKAGYAMGADAAKAEQKELMEERLSAALQQVAEAIHNVELEKQKLLEDHLEELRELSLTIAEKVINVSLKSSGDIIERMIVAATERSKNQAWAKINISSYDAEVMMQGDMGIISAMQNISSNVKVVVKENFERGDCIIEFPDQIIDAGVKTQLDNIKDIIRAGDNE